LMKHCFDQKYFIELCNLISEKNKEKEKWIKTCFQQKKKLKI
jgi:hypothetical protein